MPDIPFDPDEFFKVFKPSAGDDVSNASPHRVKSGTEAAAQGVAMGATLGTMPWLQSNVFGPMGNALADLGEKVHGPNDPRVVESRKAFAPQTTEQIGKTVRAGEEEFPVQSKIGRAGGALVPGIAGGLALGGFVPSLGGGSLASLMGNAAVTGGTMAAAETGGRSLSGVEDATLADYLMNTSLGFGLGGIGGAIGKGVGRMIDPTRDIVSNFAPKIAAGARGAYDTVIDQATKLGLKPSAGQALETAGGMLKKPTLAGEGRELSEKTLRYADRYGKRPTVETTSEFNKKLYPDLAEDTLERNMQLQGDIGLVDTVAVPGVSAVGKRGNAYLKQVNEQIKATGGQGNSPQALQQVKTRLQADLDALPNGGLTKSGKPTAARADLELGIKRMDALTEKTMPKGWREAPRLKQESEFLEAFEKPAMAELPKPIKERASSNFFPAVGATGAAASGNIPGAIMSMGIPALIGGAKAGARSFMGRGSGNAVKMLLEDPTAAANLFGTGMVGGQKIPALVMQQLLRELEPLLSNSPALDQFRG